MKVKGKRKHAKQIGDSVEIDDRNDWLQQGFLAFRVPATKKRNNAHFQQKGAFATWDVIVVIKAFVIQDKRRKKYMSAEGKIIHMKSCKLFPKTELIPMLAWRDRGIKREVLDNVK